MIRPSINDLSKAMKFCLVHHFAVDTVFYTELHQKSVDLLALT